MHHHKIGKFNVPTHFILAYNLADECYDVFMGNYRGNTYSKRHLVLDPVKDKEAFWSYRLANFILLLALCVRWEIVQII